MSVRGLGNVGGLVGELLALGNQGVYGVVFELNARFAIVRIGEAVEVRVAIFECGDVFGRNIVNLFGCVERIERGALVRDDLFWVVDIEEVSGVSVGVSRTERGTGRSSPSSYWPK